MRNALLAVALLCACGSQPDARRVADALDGGGDDGGIPSDSVDDAGRTLAPDADACVDFDADGYCDSIDPCPIDAPNDPDGDGVCSSSDKCPGDFQDDRDEDGICDAADKCPSDKPDDTDGDGVCDSDDLCPADSPDDTDSDGACDGLDKCPVDAEDDSDGDGSCDSVDACAGHDDSLDDDEDGAPDGCDTCPGASDRDKDGNGFADECDKVLWVMKSSEVMRTPPINNPMIGATIRRGDGQHIFVLAPAAASLETTSAPQSSFTISFENSDGTRTPGSYTDLIDALTKNFDNGAASGGVLFEWGEKTSGLPTQESPLDNPFVTITRVTISGYATADGRMLAEWAVRGY